MRKLLAGAVLVFGAGATSSASAQLLLKGSDTLEDVAKGVIAQCVAGGTLAAGTISYVGGGSGGGQAALLAGSQRIAPMSRPLNGAVACPGGSATTQGALDPRGEELMIGLDGVAVVGANQTHGDSLFDDGIGTAAGCPDAVVGINIPASLISPCVAADGCDPVNGYTFGSWKEVLAMLYGGQNNLTANPQQCGPGSTPPTTCTTTFPKSRNPLRINCASAVRKALADNWGTLFQSNATNCGRGATAGNCVKLKHAFRRGDLSGTTDTFVTLTGLVAIQAFTKTSAANFPTIDPTSATASAFCNAGTTPQNKGDSDYLDLDPIRRISDSDSAANGRTGREQVSEGYVTFSNPPGVLGVDTRPDPTLTAALVELPEFGASNRQNVGPDPSNVNFLAQQKAALALRKGLGLVLPVEIPTNYSDEGVAYWSPSAGPGQSPVVCDPGKFAPSLPDSSPQGICPNGNAPPCLFPVHVDPVTLAVNFNCLSNAASLPGVGLRDERVFNLLVVNSAGKYVHDAYLNPNLTLSAIRQSRVVSGFFRLHATQTTNFGGTPTSPGVVGTNVCKQFTSTDQIGCLVKANPCSIGFAGREAVDKLPNPLNSLAYQLGIAAADAKPPTDTNIYKLLDVSSTTFYPMSRKLFVNHWVDPALPVLPTMANEDILYNCFKDSTVTNPIVSTFHFLPLNGSQPFVPTGPVIDNVCPNNR